MAKPFLTYQQQIEKLTTDKHLIIDDISLAEEKLKDIGYFALIGGYKYPFRVCVLLHALSFGQLSKMYSLLAPRIKSKVSRNFPYVNEKELSALIQKYMKQSSRIDEQQLLSLMGFPANWKSITRYKL